MITCQMDGPKVAMETAAGRGAYLCGYRANQSPLAPDLYLTGAECNWADVYTGMVQAALDGGTIDNFVQGGLADRFIKMSPLGPAETDAARAQFEVAKSEIEAGGFAALIGPLLDNQGNLIVAEGTALAEDDISLESKDYLVEGVIGSIC